jgi:hypothetical protein
VRGPFFLVAVDAPLGGGPEGVAEELAAGVEGVALDGMQDLAGGGVLGEAVHLGEEVSRLPQGGELSLIVALEREGQHAQGPLPGDAPPLPEPPAKS